MKPKSQYRAVNDRDVFTTGFLPATIRRSGVVN
jgi:hypothetical protein